jgi:hypothetical protein
VTFDEACRVGAGILFEMTERQLSSSSTNHSSLSMVMKHGKPASYQRSITSGRVDKRARRAVERTVRWYLENVYGRLEGPGHVPFYCDTVRIGHFALSVKELSAERDPTLFKLFIVLAMFQARRDVLIMQHQRTMSLPQVRSLSALRVIGEGVARSPCSALGGEDFDAECSARKLVSGEVDCNHRPGKPCHVKDASTLLGRMGDMGKLPTSAWLQFGGKGGISKILREISGESPDAHVRARMLVDRFEKVFRVGRKLATMFVSALSTPALAPGFTPWFPRVDGNCLVVVDTHVARAAVRLGGASSARAPYESISGWVSSHARFVRLNSLRSDLPSFSPRVVQQALVAFSSKSNRTAHLDPCASRTAPCEQCVPELCPFVARRVSVA